MFQSWMYRIVVTFVISILNLIILIEEIKKRRSGVKYTNKLLKYTSLYCIICGAVASLFMCVYDINGFCHFSLWLGNELCFIQGVLMGIFQLSRLYYVFSNTQIHSDKGYSKWVFITMIIVGVIIVLSWSIGSMTSIRRECGIDQNLNKYAYAIELRSKLSLYADPSGDAIEIGHLAAILYLFWDLITLLLYIYKIRLFNKYKQTQPEIYKKILSISYKIFIITLFYQITSFIGIILRGIAVVFDISKFGYWGIFGRLCTTLYSLSMYLMMDYNQTAYVFFLKVIYGMKLHYCCCKYRSMVIDQLNEFDSMDHNESGNDNHDIIEISAYQTTIYQTQNNSINDQKITTNGMESSVPTKTH